MRINARSHLFYHRFVMRAWHRAPRYPHRIIIIIATNRRMTQPLIDVVQARDYNGRF